MKNIVPKDKADTKTAERLEKYSLEEITEYIHGLLQWLQDGNWPVAHPIHMYFRKHINAIEEHIITILESDDGMWKYWIMRLIANAEEKPSERIIAALKKIVANPTKDDVDCEVDIEAKEVLEELGY